ncbi:ParB N-terminal domain-containing protein [Streptomyces sp. NPDC050428]|uniref:ParB N-terminal domain-containing protein n=1 Tax=Streptomyces sp. NPDC050428 TaxID=3155757 RepID=UPI00343DC1D8
MGMYTGRMPVGMLNDKQIRPTEYTKWRHAEERFARREKDQRIMAQLMESIPKKGLTDPIQLGISERYPTDVYVGDGHHRAVALMVLGVEEFPFHWYWINSGSVRWEREPFPYHVLGLAR